MVEIRHTGIVTDNLNKSLRFWCDLLGFKIKKNQIEKGNLLDQIFNYKKVKVKTIKLSDNKKNLIEILYFYNAPKIKKKKIKPYNIGMTHLSITVKNINNLYTKLLKNKIRFNSAPQISQDGNVIMTYCMTPEGYYLELVEVL
tara:strand:- start:280 stop:708 length:429 start_codon:yes stop_codon:yes gene_type:complete